MHRSAWIIALTASSAFATAQIVPGRIYNGVGQPFPIRVLRPRGAHGELTMKLLEAVSAAPLATVKLPAWNTDLAQLFPDLWKKKIEHVLYAQLFASGQAVGPALVLQPLLNPALSKLKADGKTVEFVPDEDHAYSGIRAWVDQDVVLDTSLGELEFRMRPDAAPNTAWNFLQLAKGGFYTNIIWHRVVAKRADGSPFVIQAGDPTGTGDGGPGYNYPLEDSPLPHDFGVISMARSTDPNTNGSQFFVCLSREGTKHLDHRYASFGQLVRGKEVVLETAKVPVGKDDHPTTPPIIRRAYLVDGKPYQEIK
jgi:peptidyl-prolyl cis-trans isomerase B (cyclophilin B)